MTTLDRILTFLAAFVNSLLAADPGNHLPTWLQVLAVALVTGFAAIGIYTSSPVGNSPSRVGRR